jgi:hypothetical protein
MSQMLKSSGAMAAATGMVCMLTGLGRSPKVAA